MLFFSPIAVFATSHEDYKESIYKDFKEFQSDDFTILYPEEWIVDDTILTEEWIVDDTILTDEGIPDQFSSSTKFVEFRNNYRGESVVVVSIYEDYIGTQYSGQDYLDYVSNQIRDNCTDATIFNIGYDCSDQTINTEIIKINGKTAYKITESLTETHLKGNTYNVIFVMADILVGDDAWFLFSRTLSPIYPEYEAVIEKMIYSFSLTESEQTILTDDTPPLIITPSDIVVAADDKGKAFVEYSVGSFDNIDGVLTPSCTPSSSSFFQIGNTTVQCLATDIAGNSAEKSFIVNVQKTDAVRPQIYKNSDWGIFLELPDGWIAMEKTDNINCPLGHPTINCDRVNWKHQIILAPIDSGITNDTGTSEYPEDVAFVTISMNPLMPTKEQFQSLKSEDVTRYIDDEGTRWLPYLLEEESWGWSSTSYTKVFGIHKSTYYGYIVYDSNGDSTWYEVVANPPRGHSYDADAIDTILNSLTIQSHVVPEFHEIVLIMTVLIVSTIIIARLPRNSNLLRYNS